MLNISSIVKESERQAAYQRSREEAARQEQVIVDLRNGNLAF